ncbi:hypothetical protein EYF80_007957 [Liparis tanakae]|uniref:Uncharacterized protein n=1 Tax=Liparis tanakae TaxID=230148 RepID=A0A4Z2IWD2_9TELE|nr:hypothetical protein EYF80_007957 [Liparis tanakae]
MQNLTHYQREGDGAGHDIHRPARATALESERPTELSDKSQGVFDNSKKCSIRRSIQFMYQYNIPAGAEWNVVTWMSHTSGVVAFVLRQPLSERRRRSFVSLAYVLLKRPHGGRKVTRLLSSGHLWTAVPLWKDTGGKKGQLT